MSGSVQVGTFLHNKVNPDDKPIGSLGYYNEPSPVLVSIGGKLPVLLSAALNIWCVLLTFAKMR